MAIFKIQANSIINRQSKIKNQTQGNKHENRFLNNKHVLKCWCGADGLSIHKDYKT